MPRGSIARAVGTEQAHKGIIDMPYLRHGKAQLGAPYRHFVPNGTSLNGCIAWGLQYHIGEWIKPLIRMTPVNNLANDSG